MRIFITIRIAELAAELDAFIVYVSTDYVFSGDKGLYKEEDEPSPIDYYGYTKDEDLILPSKMADMGWLAARPKDSSLDTAKASRCLNEKPYDLDTALTFLKEELEKC